jgi:hypothetical protein
MRLIFSLATFLAASLCCIAVAQAQSLSLTNAGPALPSPSAFMLGSEDGADGWATAGDGHAEIDGANTGNNEWKYTQGKEPKRGQSDSIVFTPFVARPADRTVPLCRADSLTCASVACSLPC